MIKQIGMSDHDLGILLKSRSRVSEIINRKRPLTINQIRVLHDKLSIPADILIRKYELKVV